MHNILVGISYALSFNKNNKLIEEYFIKWTVKIHFIYPCPVALSIFSHLTTDFKFIGKVEFQTNYFQKVQFLVILHDIFLKTNMFTNLYAKLLRGKKNLEP